tara:strand:+ start:334 stop:819 length:486 start_codon:yes stop_codon:yes gene_type:complete
MNISAQHLAGCRLIYIACFLFLLNIIDFAPTILLLLIIIYKIIKYVYMKYNILSYIRKKDNFLLKRISILISSTILLLLVFLKSKKLYIKENIALFFIYLIILSIYDTNIIDIHKIYLKNDENNYFMETYIDYLKRIWSDINIIQSIIITCISVLIVSIIF